MSMVGHHSQSWVLLQAIVLMKEIAKAFVAASEDEDKGAGMRGLPFEGVRLFHFSLPGSKFPRHCHSMGEQECPRSDESLQETV